jgi:hypothetical protein
METVFKVIALVCSVQVPHAECAFGPEKPGVAVYELTEIKPKNELECGRDAQFLMAGLALKPGANEYLKISCLRVTHQPQEKVG